MRGRFGSVWGIGVVQAGRTVIYAEIRTDFGGVLFGRIHAVLGCLLDVPWRSGAEMGVAVGPCGVLVFPMHVRE